MKNKQEQLYTLLQSIEGVVWEADTDMRQFTFINDYIRPVLGFSAEDWLHRPGFWETRIHPDDRKVADSYRALKNEAVKSRSFEYRVIRADGQIAWIRDNVSLVNREGEPLLLRGVMLDNTVAERLRELERLERDMLRLNADMLLPLPEILSSYLLGLEALFPQMLCSIHRIRNGCLVSGVSPSLPQAYLAAIIGLQIGENEGSCGTAAATKQQIIVSEIATDPRWLKYRHLALEHHLQACWSNPVMGSDGEVLATLAMYYREPRIPCEEELQVMEKATALLRIILENRQQTETIREAHLLMLQSQELAHFGNWRWDVRQDVINWSPALYAIYGIDPGNFRATFAAYQALLHPGDRERVYRLIENVLQTKADAEFEERIIRPDGEVRYLRSWAKLKSDAQGQPLEMIGACLDITERVSHIAAIELRNEQLLEIAWMQSHVIRSPLTRIMALIDLLRDAPADGLEKSELLGHLLSSAYELDE